MTVDVSGPAFVRTSPAPRPAPARSALARALYLALAGLSLCLAVAGVFLPGLPSTEFVLLASWAAARGSPRLHRWLHTHRWFGPLLNNWHDGRRVPRRAKIMATVSMSACVGVMAYTITQAWIVWGAAACMAAVLLWLWRRPEPLAHAAA